MERDGAGRIVRKTTTSGGSPILSGSVGYSKSSRITSYIETRPGVLDSACGYSYNDRGQLLSESYVQNSGVLDAFAYQFDGDSLGRGLGAGVRTLAKTGGTPPLFTGSASANVFQQVGHETVGIGGSPVQWDYQYDAAGGMVAGTSSSGTQSFVWDSFGRLVAVSTAGADGVVEWTAVYDGFGRRIRTQSAGGPNDATLTSYYDPQVEFLELGIDVDASGFLGRTWKLYGPDRSGVYGGAQGDGGLLATVYELSGDFVPMVSDVFGNVTGRANGVRNQRSSAYGVVPDAVAPVLGCNYVLEESLAWRGRWIDATGLYYMGARYYDPVAGRFLSPDPLGHAASLSLYDYCNGDPVNGSDPDGRCFYSPASVSEKLNNSYNSLVTSYDTGRTEQYSYNRMSTGEQQLYDALKLAGEASKMIVTAIATEGLGDLLGPELTGVRALTGVEATAATQKLAVVETPVWKSVPTNTSPYVYTSPVRLPVAAKGVSQTTVLGENMAERVIPFAEQTGARTIPFGATSEEWEAMTARQQWKLNDGALRARINEGDTFRYIGQDPLRNPALRTEFDLTRSELLRLNSRGIPYETVSPSEVMSVLGHP